MYKVGDRVKVISTDCADIASGIKIGDVFKVIDLTTEGNVQAELNKDSTFVFYKKQIEKVEESKEMTFPEMVQKLIDGEFEVGTELINLDNVYYVGKGGLDNYGITKDKNSWAIQATFGINQLNTLWTVKEQPIKEMSIEELQKKLGYKIKIVERESN